MRRTIFTKEGLLNLLILNIRNVGIPGVHLSESISNRIVCIIRRLNIREYVLNQEQQARVFRAMIQNILLADAPSLPVHLCKCILPYCIIRFDNTIRCMMDNKSNPDDMFILKYCSTVLSIAKRSSTVYFSQLVGINNLYSCIKYQRTIIPLEFIDVPYSCACMLYNSNQIVTASVMVSIMEKYCFIKDVIHTSSRAYTSKFCTNITWPESNITLEWLAPSIHVGTHNVAINLVLDVNRNDIVNSTMWSFKHVKMTGMLDAWGASTSPGFEIKFQHESGYGSGVVREWFTVLQEKLFYQDNLIQCRNGKLFLNNQTYLEHDTCWLLGVVVALSFRLRLKLIAEISRSIICILQCKQSKLHITDMYEVDPEVTKVCRMIMDASTSDELNELGITEFMLGDKAITYHGEEMQLNYFNKEFFTKCMMNYVCGYTFNSQYISSFVQGFRGIMSGSDWQKWSLFQQRLAIASPSTINSLIGSQYRICSTKLRNIVVVDRQHGIHDNEMDVMYNNFFDHIEGYSDDSMARLLRFWTGSTYLPTCSLQLFIEHDSIPPGRLPSSQTCFYQLRLPYTSSISERLDKALHLSKIDSTIHDEPEFT